MPDMQAFEVVWQDKAWMQLEDIEDFISIDSVAAARKVVRQILKTASGLGSNPFTGQVEALLTNRSLQYRYKLTGSYKIIYRMDEMTIYIIAVFHTSRNPRQLEDEVI